MRAPGGAVAPAPEPAAADDVEAGAPAASTTRDKAAAVAEKAEAKAREKGVSWLEEREGGEGLAEHLGGADTFVLRALFVVIPLQYLAWYAAALALCVVFGTTGNAFLITFVEPFDHINFTPLVEDGEWQPLVNWLATVLTVTLADPWIVYFILRPKKEAITCQTAMQALHFFLATTVTQQTPENWIWWATTMPCYVFMGRVAEFLIARLPPKERKRRTGARTTPHNKWG